MRRSRFIISLLVLCVLTATVIVVSFDGSEKAPTRGQPQVASQPPSIGDAAAPSGEPMPVGNLPGWRQIFTDDFTTPVPLGSFPAAVASKWAAYPSPWKDTTKFGTHSPLAVDSIANGVLTQHIHTEGGVAMVSAIQPKLTTTSPYGGTYGRYALRFRTDPIDGYKVAWMLWPDLGNQPLHGEIDFPETNLDSSSMWAFVHRTSNLGGNDQASWNPPANLSDWHTAVIAWSPDLVVFTLDGLELGRTSERVPTTAMHWVLQTETAMELTAPPPAAAAGDVQIDWVAAWAYDPTTADTEDPVVTVTVPSAGSTVSGSAVAVRATATDNKGVLGVQFLLDGQELGPEDTTAPYEAVWNTKLVADGPHTLTAIGRDDAGNKGTSAAATVAVDNPPDITPPTFTTTPCLDGCTVFPLDKANVLVSFDEAVVGVSGTSFTLKNQDTGAMATAEVSYQATATTALASLDPVGLLQPDTHYTATVTSAITDPSGNAIATTSWTFATGPRPTATFTPADGATGIGRDSAVTATFNEAITGATGNFTLTTGSGTVVPTTFTYNPSTLTATLVPSAPLEANTLYTAALTANIKDAVYNALDPTSWSFTTNSTPVGGDTTPPNFTTIPCQVGCTDFPPDGTSVQVSFDEQAVGVNGASFWMKNTNTGQVVPAAVTYNSATATAALDPSTALLANTRYTATLTSAITDVSRNAIATTSWTFATGPGPVVTAMGPANGATEVDRATAVTATFSAPITGATGNFALTTGSGTVVATTMTYNSSTRTATLAPSAPLAANTLYTAALTANIKDAVYNALDPTSWSFTTNSAPVGGDTTPPNFTTIPCRTGCTDFPPDGTSVQVSFDEQAVGVNGASFWMKNTNTGQVVPAAVTYNSATATAALDPSTALLANTRYTATLTSAITDVSRNAIATTSWTFATGPGPVVTAMGPANGAAGVNRATSVTATFSAAITGTTGNFTLTTSGGTVVATTLTYDTATLTATLVPSAPLAANTQYTAVLNTNIKDVVYNALDPTSWNFTTNSTPVGGDPDPPRFTTIPCQVGCTRFPPNGTNIQVSFNEQVIGVSGASFWMKNTNTGQVVPSAVTYNSATATAALDPSAALLPNTRYTATLTSAITDVSANPIATTSWTFSTGPGPTATVTPANGATGVSRSTSVTATFSAAITGVTGNFTLKTSGGTVVATTMTYNSSTRTATLVPNAALGANTSYTATLTANIKDAVYNALTPTSWSFTTGS